MRTIDADALKELFPDNGEGSWTYNITARSYIDNAPTVCGNNPKWCESCVSKGKCASTRPQGERIEHYSKEMSEKGYFLCSRCKCGFQRFERGVRHSDLPWIDGQKYELHCIDNFCPNCGAKMQNGGATDEP